MLKFSVDLLIVSVLISNTTNGAEHSVICTEVEELECVSDNFLVKLEAPQQHASLCFVTDSEDVGVLTYQPSGRLYVSTSMLHKPCQSSTIDIICITPLIKGVLL